MATVTRILLIFNNNWHLYVIILYHTNNECTQERIIIYTLCSVICNKIRINKILMYPQYFIMNTCQLSYFFLFKHLYTYLKLLNKDYCYTATRKLHATSCCQGSTLGYGFLNLF